MKLNIEQSVSSDKSGDLRDILLSVSRNELQSRIPRINFRKIKLSKRSSLEQLLIEKNITKVVLDDSLCDVHVSPQGTIKEEPKLNILRKKSDSPHQDKQVTFNMEAQAAQDEENVIHSPSDVSMPPYEEDVVSTSGESKSLAWPPSPGGSVSEQSQDSEGIKEQTVKSEEKKIVENDKELGQEAKVDNVNKEKVDEAKKKNKPYFLSLPEESKPEESKQTDIDSQEAVKEQKEVNESNAQKEKQSGFPWSQEDENYEGLDTLFQGGLESELLGAPTETPSKKNLPDELNLQQIKQEQNQEEEILSKETSNIEQPFSEQALDVPQGDIKVHALFPEISEQMTPFDAQKEINTTEEVTQKVKGTSKNDKLKRRAGAMFGKLKLSPISIILVGGTAATLGYLLWVNNSQVQYDIGSPGGSSVRTIFKQKHEHKKSLGIDEDKVESVDLAGKVAFKPITEDQRVALIEKAREAIESRVDPFGFESFLPKKTTTKKEDVKSTAPGEVPLGRRQVELVGVISTSARNLALVNVYTVEYSVKLDDDKATRDSALKGALSMAVPNRIEVSVLDPVEDWFVKSINKSKSRTDDPSIILVHGDEQFSLNVGEKVLLPEDKTFEELSAEIKAKEAEEAVKTSNEQALLEQLGLTTKD